MKDIKYIILGVLGFAMMHSAAYAENACPEGTIAYRQVKTGHIVCFQTENVSVAEAPANEAGFADTQQTGVHVEADSDASMDAKAGDGFAGAKDESQMEAVADASENDLEASPVQPQDAPEEALFSIPEHRPEVKQILMARAIQAMADEEIQNIAQSILDGGWELEFGFGLGKGNGFAYGFRFAGGYVFSSSTSINFGLLAEGAFQFEWSSLVSAYATLTPTIGLIGDSFYLKIGLGFGFMDAVIPQVSYYAVVEDGNYKLKSREKNRNVVSFAVKPAIHTQHFLTEHAYWGIGLEIPISAPLDDDLTAFVELFISAGYKF